VLKADSEGRLGPSAYGRTHADAANVIARALRPHGGLIFYRGFVYDHHMDWRNLKNDRARAAYDNFVHLDGQFEDNAVIQIKNGPIDFQVREPASPLFGALEKTNQAIELQITQEYLARPPAQFSRSHVERDAGFRPACRGRRHARKGARRRPDLPSPRGRLRGSLQRRARRQLVRPPAFAGQSLRFWPPGLESGSEREADRRRMDPPHLRRRPARLRNHRGPAACLLAHLRELHGPLGAQTLTDITGNHYGPAVEASERNGWGQWHRADEKGIGMDRTVATGTGFIGQYRPPVAAVYESLQSCPDELLLWMHHVPYTYVLHSGKTVIQHIYDTHYRGAEDAERFVRQWKSLRGRIDEPRYLEVLARLEYQAGYAQVWRDAVTTGSRAPLHSRCPGPRRPFPAPPRG